MAYERRPASKPPFNGTASDREIGNAFRNIFQGRLDWTDEVTLTANQATSVITDLRATINSLVLFSPSTANAAAEQAAGAMYVSTYASGSFTITHANNAQTDRTFRYLVVN